MELELVYDNMESVPEEFRSLYSERDGQAVLTAVRGVDSLRASTQRLEQALANERNAHKQTRAQFGEVKGTIAELEAERDQLRLAAEGKDDPNKVDELVERRVALKTGPLEQRLRQLQEKEQELAQQLEQASAREREVAIRNQLTAAASKAKVIDTAIPDFVSLSVGDFELNDEGKPVTRVGGDIPAGLSPEEYMRETQRRRPHFWPQSQGGGARSGGAGDPGLRTDADCFSAKGWNRTKQAELVAERGAEYAQRAAQMHGVDPSNPVRPSPAAAN